MSALPRSGRICYGKICCTRGPVPVTGAEVSRICRTLAIDPLDFLATVSTTRDDPTAFAVHKGRRLSARLRTEAHGCVFLLQTNSGAGRCGLGDLAPAPCKVLPADPASMRPRVRSDLACTCRTWTTAELEKDLDQILDAAATDLDEWHDVVAKWNDYAGRKVVDASVDDFLRYVLDVYAELRAGAVWDGKRDEATGT